MVSNCPGVKLSWCQIVPSVKLSDVKLSGVNLSWCQIVCQHGRCQFVRGVKLSWCPIVRVYTWCQIVPQPWHKARLCLFHIFWVGCYLISPNLFIIHKCHKYNFNVFTHVKFKIDSNTKDLKGKWKGRSSAKNFLSQDCKTLPSHAFRSIQQNILKQDNCTS